MSRPDDIRQRVRAARLGPLHTKDNDLLKLKKHARDDIPYLLDLVERAVEFAELCETLYNYDLDPHLRERAEQWLRDGRGGQS
jgi:hypothetical protein